jgi:hypothetical protein
MGFSKPLSPPPLHGLLVPRWIDPAATHQIDSGVDPDALPCAWNGHVHGCRAAIWRPRVRNLRGKGNHGELFT